MIAATALPTLSNLHPSGNNKGTIIRVINNKVTKGTALIVSMNSTDIPLKNGKLLLRPNARKIPNGNDSNMPIRARKKVKSNPPHSFVLT